MKVKVQMYAYLDQHNHVAPNDMQSEKGVRQMSLFHDKSPYWLERGYAFIGPAEVTVEVPEVRELVDAQVEQLRKQEVAIRAKATAECTAIQTQIQNLLAIEYTPEPEAEQQ